MFRHLKSQCAVRTYALHRIAIVLELGTPH